MYKVLLAALVGLTVSLQAFAANSDDYTPEYKAYTSFSFGAPQAQSLGLHYGLRVDNDSREKSLFGARKPALLQLDFTGDSGFDSLRLYGMPLTGHTQQLNATGSEVGVGEKLLWFSGYFLLGGTIYCIAQCGRNHDDAPAAAAAPPPPPPPPPEDV